MSISEFWIRSDIDQIHIRPLRTNRIQKYDFFLGLNQEKTGFGSLIQTYDIVYNKKLLLSAFFGGPLSFFLPNK